MSHCFPVYHPAVPSQGGPLIDIVLLLQAECRALQPATFPEHVNAATAVAAEISACAANAECAARRVEATAPGTGVASESGVLPSTESSGTADLSLLGMMLLVPALLTLAGG